MDLAHRWTDRNLTRLELIVACTIIALFIGLFIRYTLVIFARTEQTMVNTTIVNINSALKYHIAMAAMLGDNDFISRALTQSPFNLIQNAQKTYPASIKQLPDKFDARLSSFLIAPANYIGDLNNPNPADIMPGQWYYDIHDNTLNYRIRNSEHFFGGMEGIPMLKFKVVLDYNDNNGNGQFDQGIDTYNSIGLNSIGNIIWTGQGIE